MGMKTTLVTAIQTGDGSAQGGPVINIIFRVWVAETAHAPRVASRPNFLGTSAMWLERYIHIDLFLFA